MPEGDRPKSHSIFDEFVSIDVPDMTSLTPHDKRRGYAPDTRHPPWRKCAHLRDKRMALLPGGVVIPQISFPFPVARNCQFGFHLRPFMSAGERR